MLFAKAYGYSPSEVDDLTLREMVVMQTGALMRDREAWEHTTYVSARVANYSLRAPTHPVQPQQLLDEIYGASRGVLSDDALAEAKRLHEERIRKTKKRKRRQSLLGRPLAGDHVES